MSHPFAEQLNGLTPIPTDDPGLREEIKNYRRAALTVLREIQSQHDMGTMVCWATQRAERAMLGAAAQKRAPTRDESVDHTVAIIVLGAIGVALRHNPLFGTDAIGDQLERALDSLLAQIGGGVALSDG